MTQNGYLPKEVVGYVADKAAKNLTTDQIISLGGMMMDKATKK